MLSTISWGQRKIDDVESVFGGKSQIGKRVEKLKTENSLLRRKIAIFSNELERIKADELFEKLTDHGDPFPLLSSLEPDEVQ